MLIDNQTRKVLYLLPYSTVDSGWEKIHKPNCPTPEINQGNANECNIFRLISIK